MKKLFLILLFIPFCAHAQIITTYAGNGIADTLYGNGGPATAGSVASPSGLNFDDTGNLLICQVNLVRKVNKLTNIISTIAGADTANGASCGGTGGDGCLAITASITTPEAICVDSADNYYIDDAWYSEIRKVTIATGIIDTFAGDRNVGSSGDGGPAKNAELGQPKGVCFDTGKHFLYISDELNNRVRKVNMLTDTISTFAGTGVNGYSGDGGPAINAEFSHVYGICIDNANNLYICDRNNARIRKVDAATGIVTTIVGNGTTGYSGDGGLATNAMINTPAALCFDKCGNLYFSEYNGQRVRRVDGVTGVITTIAGNGTIGYSGDSGLAVNAQFNGPFGVAIDSSGNLFISDQENNRVRKVTIFNPIINISITPGDTLCFGTPVRMYALFAGGGPTPHLTWHLNGSFFITGDTCVYIPHNGDSISCTLLSSSPCVGNPVAISNTIHFVVDSVTIPAINLAGNPAATIGSFVTVNATVAGAGSSYTIHWYDNSVLFNTTTVPTVTYTKTAGTDHITATVIPTSAGCFDSTTSAVFSVTDTTTGLTVPSQRPGEVSIYPNPATTKLVITSLNKINKVTITNMLGQTVQSIMPDTEKAEMNIAPLPSGIYFVKVICNDSTSTPSQRSGEVSITKIIKQ